VCYYSVTVSLRTYSLQVLERFLKVQSFDIAHYCTIYLLHFYSWAIQEKNRRINKYSCKFAVSSWRNLHWFVYLLGFPKFYFVSNLFFLRFTVCASVFMVSLVANKDIDRIFNFFISHIYYTPLLDGDCWNFVTIFSMRILKLWGYWRLQKFENVFGHIYALMSVTDR